MPDMYDWFYEIRVNTLHQITQLQDLKLFQAMKKIEKHKKGKIREEEKDWQNPK